MLERPHAEFFGYFLPISLLVLYKTTRAILLKIAKIRKVQKWQAKGAHEARPSCVVGAPKVRQLLCV